MTFLLFASDSYEPQGGWDDFIDLFDSFESAKAHAEAHYLKRDDFWAHIVEWGNPPKLVARYPTPSKWIGDRYTRQVRAWQYEETD